ncbi:hypothetical protein [Petrotoga sp. SL27]
MLLDLKYNIIPHFIISFFIQKK